MVREDRGSRVDGIVGSKRLLSTHGVRGDGQENVGCGWVCSCDHVYVLQFSVWCFVGSGCQMDVCVCLTPSSGWLCVSGGEFYVILGRKHAHERKGNLHNI